MKSLKEDTTHKGSSAVQKLKDILRDPPRNAKINKIGTLPKPAMPEEVLFLNDTVASYRKYYIMKKNRFATMERYTYSTMYPHRGVECRKKINGKMVRSILVLD